MIRKSVFLLFVLFVSLSFAENLTLNGKKIVGKDININEKTVWNLTNVTIKNCKFIINNEFHIIGKNIKVINSIFSTTQNIKNRKNMFNRSIIFDLQDKAEFLNNTFDKLGIVLFYNLVRYYDLNHNINNQSFSRCNNLDLILENNKFNNILYLGISGAYTYFLKLNFINNIINSRMFEISKIKNGKILNNNFYSVYGAPISFSDDIINNTIKNNYFYVVPVEFRTRNILGFEIKEKVDTCMIYIKKDKSDFVNNTLENNKCNLDYLIKTYIIKGNIMDINYIKDRNKIVGWKDKTSNWNIIWIVAMLFLIILVLSVIVIKKKKN